MKKIFYFVLIFFAALTIYASKANAQYYITSESWLPITDSGTICHYPEIYVTTNAYTAGLSIATYYGDGSSTTYPVSNGGSYGYANCYGFYSSPGTYTVKQVLLNGVTPVDSVVSSHEFLYCSTAIIKCVYDSLGTGIYDNYDRFLKTPVTLEVEHNGIPVDTVTIASGWYCSITGALGDVYAFKVLSMPPGIELAFPAGGVIYDTILDTSNNYIPKFFGFKCSGTTGFDLSVIVTDYWSGVHAAYGAFYVSNASCNMPVPATVTVNFSPKFIFQNASPYPYSFLGNTITWNLGDLTLENGSLLNYNLTYNPVTGEIPYGDTLYSTYNITPETGDINPSNNIEIILDTDRHSHDPNNMSVSPSGYITAGTTLQYTINFENTGNDTAFNISVYDTLSDNVNPRSLNIVMASAVMNIAILNQGGLNIVKFDFPNINLLDSSHHGLCDGAVIFTVNAKPLLADGTTIFNHAGIFFDYNPVVITDTVEDIIGPPLGIAVISNPSKITLYPNPASTSLTITSTNNISQIAIANVLGQTVFANQYNTQQAQVDVANLSAGVYFVKVNGSEVRKFVKE